MKLPAIVGKYKGSQNWFQMKVNPETKYLALKIALLKLVPHKL